MGDKWILFFLSIFNQFWCGNIETIIKLFTVPFVHPLNFSRFIENPLYLPKQMPNHTNLYFITHIIIICVRVGFWSVRFEEQSIAASYWFLLWWTEQINISICLCLSPFLNHILVPNVEIYIQIHIWLEFIIELFFCKFRQNFCSAIEKWEFQSTQWQRDVCT